MQAVSQAGCGEAGASSVVQFWLSLLTNLPNWTKDRNVLYLVDRLIQTSHTLHGAWDDILQFFHVLHKVRAMGYG